MKVYYNKFFKGNPYIDIKESISFDTCYCGDISLLSLLMLHGGIPAPQITPEERKAVYHNHLLRNSDFIIKGSPFQDSFATDSYATASKLLEWRDILVSEGWKMEKGESAKLNFLISVEPESLPRGTADCWKEIIDLSSIRLILPQNTQLIVCHEIGDLEPRVRSIFKNQEELGLKIEYLPKKLDGKKNDIGNLKHWLAEGQKSELKYTGDGTLTFMSFEDDDAALKFVATQNPQDWELYLCQEPKKFDNILRYLGQPACGSELSDCEPQVVNLFLIGNGLFEYPLNLDRILAWLEAPVNPLGRSFAHSLARALTATGGVDNREWEEAINKYLDSKGLTDKERDKMIKNIREFLPFPESEIISCEEVIRFNEKLKSWANGILFLNDFPYEEIVREQLREIDKYCETLISLLINYDKATIRFIDLQKWCSSIVSPGTYTQYESETGSRSLISQAGNIFSRVSSMVWFCIYDAGAPLYPFDFLTDKEICSLVDSGVFIYDRNTYNSFFRNAVIETVMSVESLTLIEATKVNGEKVKRHPLMIQIDGAIEGGLKGKVLTPEIGEENYEETKNIDNRSDDCYVKIDERVEIPLRFDLGKTESYSSVDLLTQHPFDYVCKNIAGLRDTKQPSIEAIKKTKGNVAHRMIELVFGPGSKGIEELTEEEYQKIFDYAIQNVGLLLLRPEYIMDYNELKTGMKEGIMKLSNFFKANNLTVEGTEVDLETMSWLPGTVDLWSRCDMILSDDQGNKVVLDFKWSHVPLAYIEMVREGLSAQLIVYSYLIQKQYGCKVRSAYVSFPSCRVITSDNFIGVEKIEDTSRLTLEEKVTMLANGVKFRQKQFQAHTIEHTEGMEPEMSEYYLESEKLNLFPLKLYNNKLNTPLDKDYINFR